MSNLYTVYRADDSGAFTAGLTLEEAADRLLAADGYTYEIREDADGYKELFVSELSGNASGGPGRLRRVTGAFDVAEIWRWVVNHDDSWHGMLAATDEAAAAQRVVIAARMQPRPRQGPARAASGHPRHHQDQAARTLPPSPESPQAGTSS